MSNRPVEDNDFLKDPSVLNLNRVVFIGRTFSEYMAMFNLHPFKLKGLRILDCPSGTSSFVAEALSSRYQIKEVIGCDLLYKEDNVDELKNRGKEDLDYMINNCLRFLIFMNGTSIPVLEIFMKQETMLSKDSSQIMN